MTPELFIKRQLKAQSVLFLEQVQNLWSGYGHLSRYQVSFLDHQQTVILKAIKGAAQNGHPRGWQSDFAHQRKLKSYQVERHWYACWATNCPEEIRMATCFGQWELGQSEQSEQSLLLLEDLDQSGFPLRYSALSLDQIPAVLIWLANFHAHFIVENPASDWPKGLWEQGTYWHLATRPQEWQSMVESELKWAAEALDNKLRQATYQTLVHGDAKLANFCFAYDGSVAAVDFQYVGRGIGVQDLAYFLGSCMTEQALEKHLDYLLDLYFSELTRSIVAKGESPDFAESVSQEWFDLFPVAWADFHRFLLGWCPEHNKVTAFSDRMTRAGLAFIKS